MKIFLTSILLISFAFTLFSSQVNAQNQSSENRIGFGFSAGTTQTNLTSADGYFRETVDPFLLNSSNNLNLQFHAVHDFGLYESIRLDVSTREFSVATNYSEWPSLTFDNTMISTVLSAELSMFRYLAIQPRPLNVYGKVGFGFNSNSFSADFQGDGNSTGSETSSSLSAMYTVGGGLRYHITPALSFFSEYDLVYSNTDIIDPGFVNDFIDTDFTQTASRWGALSAGLRITFPGKRNRSAPSANRPFSEITPAQQNNSLSALNIVATNMTYPIPFRHQSDLLEQVTLEYRARFQSYTTLPFPFTDNEKFFEAARNQNSVQAPEPAIPSSTYGVNGIWNPDFTSGYTIIVHSLTLVTDANRIAEDLQNSGLRTTVLNVVVNGRNYYRVAIGQFTTRDDASSAANQLPSPLNSSFFVAQLPEQ